MRFKWNLTQVSHHHFKQSRQNAMSSIWIWYAVFIVKVGLFVYSSVMIYSNVTCNITCNARSKYFVEREKKNSWKQCVILVLIDTLVIWAGATLAQCKGLFTKHATSTASSLVTFDTTYRLDLFSDSFSRYVLEVLTLSL